MSAETPEQKLRRKSAEYDALVESRAYAARRYDRSADGSAEKVAARAALARLGRQVREVEDELGALVDELPA